MININLLPIELQKAAKTPRAVFFSLVGGVAAVMIVGFGVLWLWMSVRILEREVDSHKLQVKVLQEEAREVDRLNEDISLYKDRERAIIEIKSHRVFWGLKLYQLVQRTPDDVWVTRLSMSTLPKSDYSWKKGGVQDGGEMKIKCFSKGTEVGNLTKFRSNLIGGRHFYSDLIEDASVFPDNFFGMFSGYSPLEFKTIDLEGYSEPRCLQSDISITMKPQYDAPKAKAAKGGK